MGRRLPRTTTTSFATAGVMDEVMLRGKRLALDVGDGVLSADFSVGMDTISELAVTVYDPQFEILESGLFAPGGRVDLRTYLQEITATETGSAADGRGQVTIRCRAAAIGRLTRRVGPKVMNKASPSDFVKSECKAVKAKYVIQPSAKRKHVSRDHSKSSDEGDTEKPSSWTTFVRLARELGYAVFESENTIYFGKPSWLLKRDGTSAVVSWDTGEGTDCVGVPAFSDILDESAETGVSVSFEVPRERFSEFPPGGRVNMDFPIYGEQTYLVTQLSMPVAGVGNASVTAGKPIDPKPEPPPKKTRNATRGGTAGTSGVGGPRAGGSRTIGDLCRKAGFTGNALNIAVGVAYAESRCNAHALGDLNLVDAKWGPSVGVFQIRSLRHPAATGPDSLRNQPKLMGAMFNATAAYRISAGGTNWHPWSTYNSGAYRAYVGQTDRLVTNWVGLPGPPRPPAFSGGPTNPTSVTGRKSAFDFVNLCLRQIGDAYSHAEVSLGDPDPGAFDCSELIEWAAHRVGCYMPDYSATQIAHCIPISVAAGTATRGAILYHPGHVAVSLGGHTGTVEAANYSVGVTRYGPSRSTPWTRAGRIPGMRYG